MYSINCKGTLIDFSTPKVMGILNVTPDSFYDGGNYSSDKKILTQVSKMLLEGADFIDVGGYSSKPYASEVSVQEELQRVLPVVRLLIKEFPDVILSVDTFRSEVANACIQEGAAMINDISSGSFDKKMFETVASLQVPYVMMHMQGNPQNMQQNPTYKNLITEIMFFFSKKITELRKLGVNDIVTDVGFGFGKTLEHNYELLKNLEIFKNLEVPILVGISRKSMLNKLLGITAKDALNATTAAHTVALLNGANILRVHDVREAVEAIKIVEMVH